ncbi:MAG: hypothetical protein JRH06_14280 [Deltaproteobacteria bacterium]|nr:hypothetical protein [Deltaproteobacteria bacterium]MBW2138706.1 hypothetical protein [Deltaproteobacteria bacterium]
MVDKEERKEEGKAKKKKWKPGNSLPYCTNAPSAEHARAELEDEPCDDFREGE